MHNVARIRLFCILLVQLSASAPSAAGGEPRGRRIRCLASDFDGTWTDSHREARGIIAAHRRVLARTLNVGEGHLESLLQAARAHALADPHAGWRVPYRTRGGTEEVLTAPARAEPLVLERVAKASVLGELLRADTKEGRLIRENVEQEGFDPDQHGPILQHVARKAAQEASNDSVFRDGAAEALDWLCRRYDVHFITNSPHEVVAEKLARLAHEHNATWIAEIARRGDERIQGRAEKFSLDDSYDAFGASPARWIARSIQPRGVSLPVYLRRRSYGERLARFDPAETAVFGDIYDFDVALPSHLGFLGILLETEGTDPRVAEYLRRDPNGALVRNYRELRCLLE